MILNGLKNLSLKNRFELFEDEIPTKTLIFYLQRLILLFAFMIAYIGETQSCGTANRSVQCVPITGPM